jgi:hypothetical protein
MNTQKLRHSGILMMIASTAIVCAQEVSFALKPSNSDSLKPYLSCNFDDGLKIKETTHRDSSGDNFREIKIGNEIKKVSVVDGYRVMFTYKGAHYFFVNMKVERSDSKEYEYDKSKLIDVLKYFATTEKPRMIYRDRTMINGYESYGVDREFMDYGGVIGNHIIFFDVDHIIVTVYFLNQGKEARRFHNLDEYHVLRDRFLDRYTTCIKGAIR